MGLNFDVVKDLEKNLLYCRSAIFPLDEIELHPGLYYLQNMATNGVKNIGPSADPTMSNISLFSLSILGVRRLA